MTKLRLTITFEMEYEPTPDFYMDKTPLGMLQTDISNAKRYPLEFIDAHKYKTIVSGEVVGNKINEWQDEGK